MRTTKPKPTPTRIILCIISILVQPFTSAAYAATVEVTSQPSLPFAATPFKYHVKIVTTGAPVTVSQTSASINGARIDLVVCLVKGSSSTAPVTVTVEVPVGALELGSYDLRLTRLVNDGNGVDCQTPTEVFSGQTFVVAPEAARTVVEYYNAPRDHYFQTADAIEIAALDAGMFSGWQRTGYTYQAYAAKVVANTTPARPVCRYYGKPEAGLDTHFFSAFAFECAIIPTAFPNQWIIESENAFAISIPAQSDGTCPLGTLSVYRLFNFRPDVNHRYTVSLEVRQEMMDKGWTPEGYGSVGVAMCAESTS